MIRTKGEAGTGDVVEAVRHIRTLHKEPRGFPGSIFLTRVDSNAG